ncbi:MAG: hypothetical protein EBX49_06415 [Synechococcaceae bacterium WB8_1B_136]|nr:hypothetical protein [Synechococcaceae bacterium WB8_1B_136]
MGRQLAARLVAPLAALLVALVLVLVPALAPGIAWAGPVDWREVPASSDGRQWWDAGSLRISKGGNLTALSRFQPAAPDSPEGGQRPAASSLYVMEIDCGQHLFRDTSVNGIPQWGSSWQAAGVDDLIERTIEAVCTAGAELLAGS